MSKIKNILNFHTIKRRALSSGLALLTLFLLLLIPIHPFRGESSHQIELLAGDIEGREVYDLLKVYSMLKSQRTDLSDRSAWVISEAIVEESRRHSIDPALILAVISVESSFRKDAVSSKGARGLMQIRPFVASALAREVNLDNWEGEDSLYDPTLNIKLGVFYLSYLKKSFRDLTLALAAYNWGPTRIRDIMMADDESVPVGYAVKVLSTYDNFHRSIYHRPKKH